MRHRPRQLAVRNPKWLLSQLFPSSSHRHARSLRTIAVDCVTNFPQESRLSPRTASFWLSAKPTTRTIPSSLRPTACKLVCKSSDRSIPAQLGLLYIRRCCQAIGGIWLRFVPPLLYTEALSQDTQALVEQLRAGDSRALARVISAVENRTPGWSELLKALFPHTGRARILGLTGAPGAGKSTLVDQLARLYRKENRTGGIIAADPTSPYTGGAILGDRIRMQEHFSGPGIYIRSMATRGSLGGLARATADVTTLLDASGRDLIMIETVGVGQDDIDVMRVADITLVILVPGMGDDVQTIKAGIMEIADIFVINKSDRDGAERVEREIRALQSLAVRG